MMSVKRLALVLVTLGACASVALAAPGDPQKKYTRAGQAREGGRVPDRRLPARLETAAAAEEERFTTTVLDLQPGPVRPRRDRRLRLAGLRPRRRVGDLVLDQHLPDRADGEGGLRADREAGAATLPAELFAKGTKPNPTTIFSAGALQFPTYGDRSSAYRITGSVKTPSVRVRFALDVVVFNRGAVDAAVLMLGIGQPLGSGLEQSLVAKLAARAG